MGIKEFVGDAQVVSTKDCLFESGPWGVRQQTHNPYEGYVWYHHAWGITDEADAHVLADRLNKEEA